MKQQESNSGTMYYNEQSLTEGLDGLAIAVIGYGIQGRAFAANLRDSGVAVHVGNIDDEYRRRAVQEGHVVFDIGEAVGRADIVLMLIPDEAHKRVFLEEIAPNHRPGSTLIVAHGHSLMQGHVFALPELDLALLAPRMYGDPIRKLYLEGKGAPAYIDIVSDESGMAQRRTLAIAEAVGFTRAGVMRLDYRQETLLDLFQEQFIAPALVDLVETGFKVLVEHGFDPRAALLEVYGSGEMGKMMLDGADIGLDEVVERQGSPTCQVGYHLYRDKMLPVTIERKARKILESLVNGEFAKRLKKEAEKDYPMLQTARRAVRQKALYRTHEEVRSSFRFPRDNDEGIYLRKEGAA